MDAITATIVPSGFGLGAVLATAGELAAGHWDPVTVITSAGVCGVIAWVLLQAQIARSKRDAEALSEERKELVQLIKDGAAAHREASIKSQELTNAINSLVRVTGESVESQRNTANQTRDLVVTLNGRPCLCEPESKP